LTAAVLTTSLILILSEGLMFPASSKKTGSGMGPPPTPLRDRSLTEAP
jgi:hypothetical protein